jgi:uroporphyrinogen III methyltransferase/synthase
VAVPAYRIRDSPEVASSSQLDRTQGFGKSDQEIAWDKLTTATDTLVVLMGIGNLANVVNELIKNKKPPTTPVAVITHGTTDRQCCVTGTLQDIVEKVKGENLKPPSVGH